MTRDELLAIKAQAEKLTRDDPSSADAWRNLAQAKMMLGDFDGAIDDCIECLRLSPSDEYGLILLGNIYVNGKKDVATGLTYVKTNPNKLVKLPHGINAVVEATDSLPPGVEEVPELAVKMWRSDKKSLMKYADR